MKIWPLSAGLIFSIAASLQAGNPYQLTQEDQALVEQSVADETAMPDRTRVTGITASISDAGVISVCGYVKWIDGSGLYGPYRPFDGVLGSSTSGERIFVVSGIARDARSQDVFERVCAQDGMPIRPSATILDAPAPPQKVEPPEGVARMIEIARDLNSRCRGTEGADPTSTICSERDAAFSVVRLVGWCFGREGEAGYLNVWHPCGPGSVGY